MLGVEAGTVVVVGFRFGRGRWRNFAGLTTTGGHHSVALCFLMFVR